MYIEEVRSRLEDIRQAAFSDEQAHILEDCLLKDVLQAISLGQCQDAPPEDFAALALEVWKLRSRDLSGQLTTRPT